MAARGPIVPPPPVVPPPRLVRLRCTTDEAALIVHTLRGTSERVAEARRLADVLGHELALQARAAPRAR
jgi:hypothetical protein